MKLSLSKFTDLLCENIDKITSHSFIPRSQSSYLAHIKETIRSNEAIALGDFAENYLFIIQDEIQGYHWNESQCSNHPIVVYYVSNNVLANSSLCILSDDLKHDVSFGYKVLHETVAYIKEVNPAITKICYFLNSCASQNKNCKHFLNLCHHTNDFSVECVWNFFETSHSKSSCNGICGTVKRLIAQANLQLPVTDEILSAKDMMKFCEKSINGIKFVCTPSKAIVSVRSVLISRFTLVIKNNSWKKGLPLV